MKNVFLVFLVCFFTTGASAARPSSRNFRSLADRKAEGQRVEQEKVEAHEETSPQVEVERPEPSEPAEPLEKYVYTGPKKGWGILMEQAPYYTPQGKNLGKLTSGCVFTYDGVRHGSGDRFLFVVTFREPPSPGAPLGPYLLDCDRAAIYGGSPDDASPAPFRLLRGARGGGGAPRRVGGETDGLAAGSQPLLPRREGVPPPVQRKHRRGSPPGEGDEPFAGAAAFGAAG